MIKEAKKVPAKKHTVPLYVKLGYGTGHVLNDMLASFWFTYLLLFFHRVLGFSNSLAGVVMVVGQIADGLSTVFVGYFQDKGRDCWLCRVYPKRKAWHLLGTILLLCSVPFVFNTCWGCSNASNGFQIIYYCFFVVVSQFGWACAQISHLALIPDLTACKMERTILTSYRYSATVLATLVVYVSMWALLGPLSSDEQDTIGPSNAPVFRDVVFICMGLGGIMSLTFHVAVRLGGSLKSDNGIEESLLHTNDQTLEQAGEDNRNDDAREEWVIMKADGEHVQRVSFSDNLCILQSKSEGDVETMKVLDWLQEPQLYQVCCLYLCARLFVNLSQSYITLYLDVTLELIPISVAVIPLVMFLVSLATSPLIKTLTRIVGRRGAVVVACMTGLGGSAWVWFGDYNDPFYANKLIFVVAGLFGAGGSAMLITSISATADLIGDNVESSAFVYGMTSLADKFSSAVAFGVIQNLVPNDDEETGNYYKDILVFVCGGAAIFPMFILMTMIRTKLGRRRRDRRRSQN